MRVLGILAVAVFFGAGLLFFRPCKSAAQEGQRTDFSLRTTDDYIKKMLVPRRAEWQMPGKVVDALGIKEGDKVADIGAGAGYFTFLLSKKVGDKGKVYAVDVERKYLEYIESRAKKEGVKNIECILAPQDDPRLPKASIDLAFMCTTLVYIGKKDKYLKELKDALKEGGRLAIVDYHMVNSKPDGPPPYWRIAREKVMEYALRAGFRLEAEYFFLPFQYFLVFTK